MTIGRRGWRWGVAVALGGVVSASAAEPQNPSPMVEHTREHRRLEERRPDGKREKTELGSWFIPAKLAGHREVPLLIFFHGGSWLPEVAGEQASSVVWHVQRTGSYARLFEREGSLTSALREAETRLALKWSRVVVGGWSAGCAAIREMLKHLADAARIDAVVLLDGVHAEYVGGKPGPTESTFRTEPLSGLVDFSRHAMAGKKRLLLVHSEIFPGTFASTTETADWILRELGLKRKAVLEWGPMGTQQLSDVRSGQLRVAGFAGNSAPDHVDLLHGLSEFLRWVGAER